MSESAELNTLFAVLQVVGILAFFICCLTCLYHQGMREKNRRIHDEQIHSTDLKSRVESLEKKLKALENSRFVTIV